jgi:hypothetical protein
MKRIHLILLLVITLPLSSCINLVEEFWMNSDKSGRMEIRLDAGNLGFLFSTIHDYLDKKMVKELTQAPGNYAKSLKQVPGISSVKPVSNFKNGKLELSFAFDNQKALNKAWYKMLGVDKKFYYPNIYKLRKNKLKKKNLYKYFSSYVNDNKDKIKSEDVFKFISVHSIYHLPDEVNKIKNTDHTKITRKKVVMQQYTLKELLSDEIDLGQQIKF